MTIYFFQIYGDLHNLFDLWLNLNWLFSSRSTYFNTNWPKIWPLILSDLWRFTQIVLKYKACILSFRRIIHLTNSVFQVNWWHNMFFWQRTTCSSLTTDQKWTSISHTKTQKWDDKNWAQFWKINCFRKWSWLYF